MASKQPCNLQETEKDTHNDICDTDLPACPLRDKWVKHKAWGIIVVLTDVWTDIWQWVCRMQHIFEFIKCVDWSRGTNLKQLCVLTFICMLSIHLNITQNVEMLFKLWSMNEELFFSICILTRMFTTQQSDMRPGSCAPLGGSSLFDLWEVEKDELEIFFLIHYSVKWDSTCNLTFDKFAPVGFLWEKSPQVCDARHCDGQKFLYNYQGLLLRRNLIRKQLSFLYERDKWSSDWQSEFKQRWGNNMQYCTCCAWVFIGYSSFLSQSKKTCMWNPNCP